MAVADTHHAESGHDHHEHPEFIAHHFENAEQQFDSGKLGIWLFLVTEVLFFSGLFVAYTLYRSHHPEIFAQAHVFLDKVLGGINTVVLLFSSLTMALAVRAAQLSRNRNCAIYILITMVCAAVFLGVKAIEYSHKWDMGILVRSGFALTYEHAEPTTGVGQALGISDYLVYLSIVPTVLLALFLAMWGLFLLNGKKVASTFSLCLAITVGGYFLGAVGGHIYMGFAEGESMAANQPVMVFAQEQDTAEAEQTGAAMEGEADHEEHADGDHAEGDHAEGQHAGQEHAGGHGHAAHEYSAHHPDPATLDRDIGIFFSIYYCMTGLHAIHIIAGIIALAWILWRSLLGQWRSDYFGPVEYVGLYWHLVDLIWIYLFPMLYLID